MSLISLLAGLGNAALNNKGARTRIGVFELDALLKEGSKISNTKTRYPVESGAPISDFIAPGERSLSISGAVTSMSMGIPRALLDGTSITGSKSRLSEAKRELEAIAEARQPITIVTGLDVYRDYVIEELSIERSAENGERLDISISLSELRTTTLGWAKLAEASTAPQVRRKASHRKSAGKPQTKTPSEATQVKVRKSMGASLYDGAKSLFRGANSQ